MSCQKELKSGLNLCEMWLMIIAKIHCKTMVKIGHHHRYVTLPFTLYHDRAIYTIQMGDHDQYCSLDQVFCVLDEVCHAL